MVVVVLQEDQVEVQELTQVEQVDQEIVHLQVHLKEIQVEILLARELLHHNVLQEEEVELQLQEELE
jgi:hypothetical protein